MQRIALAWTVALALVAGSARAAERPAAKPVVDPKVIETVQRAADRIHAAERFSFTAETSYEAVQSDGSKLEFGAARKYWVHRPDRVRIEVAPREGDDRVVLFDGDQLVVAHPAEKTYGLLRFKQHREIDEALVLLQEVLGVPVPLGDLLRRDPRPELVDSITAAIRVGTAKLDGTECDHVALRNPDADVQLWITRGDAPLLRRVVITYRNAKGAPSFAADLRDWALDANESDDLFRYVPPADAQRVRFAIPPRPADLPAKKPVKATP